MPQNITESVAKDLDKGLLKVEGYVARLPLHRNFEGVY